jgi:adenosine deaminase
MKRGRPTARSEATTTILQVLEKSQVPLTASSIRNSIIEEFKQKFSWNTIQKYLNELIQTNKLEATNLPHSKTPNKTGLTVYTLKK